MEIIPKTEDKYISYSFDGIQFKDSFSFMASSLDSLVKNLRNDEDYDSPRFIFTTKIFKERYPNENNERFKIVVKRGVYPYEYMTISINFKILNYHQLKTFFKVK